MIGRLPAVWTGPAVALALWVGERLLGRRPPAPAPQGAPRPPEHQPSPLPAPTFTPAQVADVTEVEGGAQAFRPDVAASLRRMLRHRSAVPVPVPDLGARVGTWAVCPLRPDAEVAADVVDRAEARGMAVLGSVSLVLLATGQPCAAILVVAPDPRDAAALSAPPGVTAIFPPAAPPRVAAQPPAQAPAQAPAVAAPPAPPAEVPPADQARAENERAMREVVEAEARLAGERAGAAATTPEAEPQSPAARAARRRRATPLNGAAPVEAAPPPDPAASPEA